MSTTKKKNKTYEHDYEWSGNAGPVKGVNIVEKNPWSKPGWNTIIKNDRPAARDNRSAEQKPTDWNQLQKQHQWKTPEWATMKGKDNSNKAIIKDSVPKPMLKNKNTPPQMNCSNNGKSTAAEVEAEIAEMERRIAEAKQQKISLQGQQQDQKGSANEAERHKHTVNETKLERARREAKEREEARWRATLVERNARDKAKREEARHAALSVKVHDDTSWQNKQSSRNDAVIAQKIELPMESKDNIQMPAPTSIPALDVSPTIIGESTADDDESVEYVEEYVDDDEDVEYEEVYVEEDYEEHQVVACSAEDLQRQIDALRQQLASVQ